MKNTLFMMCCLFLLLLVFETKAQKQPPKTTKTTVQAKNFTSVEGGFSVKFPKTPTKSTQPMNSAFGRTTMTTFEATTNFASYRVMYVDFPSVINDETELNARYDAMKGSLATNPNFNLVSEKVVYYKEHLGREFLIEGANVSMTMRGFIVEQRMFQLVVVTPGKMSRASAKVKAANQKRIDDFINSFTVTTLPSPKTEAIELPEDFGITLENSVFSSKFLGFSYVIPQDWTVLSDEQVDLVKDIGLEAAQQKRDYRDNSLEKAFQNAKFLLITTDQPIESGETDAMLMIIAERVSFPNFLPSAVTSTYVKTYLDPTEKVVKNTTMTKINGVDFAWIETFDSASKTKLRMYVTNRRGIALEIFFNYKTDAQLQTLMKSLNSIKFYEG